jgi:Zn-dependent protease with chaperone function
MMEFDGSFADGQVAVRRPVRLLVGAQTVSLLGLDGTPIETWTFRHLSLAEEVYPGQPARIINKERRGANIRVDDPAAITEICKRIPRLSSRNLARWKPSSRLLFWATTAAVTIVLLGLGVPHFAEIGARLVPTAWAQSFGRTAVKHMPGAVCNAVDGSKALDVLTLRLASQVTLPVALEVQVLDRDEINAFAAPGGQIVILSGLLVAAESPEELAAVLAHEIGHVAERHPMRGVLRQAGLALVVGAVVGDVSTLGVLAADLGKFLALMSYSRNDEEAADAIAIDILNASNIRGDGFVRFFERLQPETPGETPDALQLFASHPGNTERLDSIRARATGQGNAMSLDSWKSLQTICSSE